MSENKKPSEEETIIARCFHVIGRINAVAALVVAPVGLAALSQYLFPSADGCGREPGCPGPPRSDPYVRVNAYGSYLGWWTANRVSGQGCRTRTGGQYSAARRVTLVIVIRVFCDRRRKVLSHRHLRCQANSPRVGELVGTA